MKSKKLKLLVIAIMSVVAGMTFMPKSKASTPLATPVYFGVQEFRSGTTPENMGYAIKNPAGNDATTNSIYGTIIWNILKYSTNKVDESGIDGNFYCVRSGVGFQNTGDVATYNITYDLKTEKNALASSGNSVLASIANNGYYNNLLALTDLIYLRGVSTDEEKAQLEEAAQISSPILTDDDIEAVQQAAIWYYTNHDDTLFETLFNNYGENKTSWLFYRTLEMSQAQKQYESLSDYNRQFSDDGIQIGEGLRRQQQAVQLYNYLITTANKNATAYENGTAVPKTKVTLYTNAEPSKQESTQPIISLEKIPEVKDFDLALRKYITKVDNVELTGEASRVPSIDESTIKTEQTATYKHKKDPVTVKTGSIVTYNLTVYNEGEKAGRATKIIDQLPTGLKYSKINTKGFTAAYNQTTNQLTITRESNNTTNLDAYTEGNLKSETIEIECEVTAMPDSSNKKILTNVAWIAEEFDAVDNVTITNQKGKDLDSEPSTTPDVNKDNMSNYSGNNNKEDLTDSSYYYKGQQDDDDFEKLVLNPAAFDLKLIKRIVEVNGTKVPERIEGVDITNLANKTATTATYKLNKEPVAVKKGDIVKYTFRVYNEGDIDGYASEITEDIPDGLELVWSEKNDDELNEDTTLTQAEKTAIKYNQSIWDFGNVNTETGKVETIKTDYLAKGKGAEIATDKANLIKAFDATKAYTNTVNDKNPDYKEVSVYLKVTSNDTTGTIIRNEAAITKDSDSEGNEVKDRDSDTDKWVKYEDDEDYDNIKLQSFDLALRKFIIAVSEDTQIKDTDYLKNQDGTYTRAPIVDTSKLNTTDNNGNLITTATYNHTKEPVEVSKGDIVVYMLRVYNEGDINGYASQIKDHLPSYLEYVESDFNTKYGWKVSEDGRTVTTEYLDNHMIEKTSTKEDGTIVLSYKEVPIMCKVKDTAKTAENITNIADITIYKDENKNSITDRDSSENNVKLPSDEELPKYKEEEKGSYVPGQEDDDDFEKVIVKPLDLALRKFITGVNDEEVTNRIPEVSYNKENNKITYNHTKEPVEVVTNDTVIYTIRVFNEGEIDGYASKISDDLPAGLEYLPENELNKEYRWVMYDKDGKETTKVSEAVKITTDYLSKEQGEARMKENSDIKENPALLKAFDGNKEISETNPDYADVQVAFKVVEPNRSDKIIINSAQISDDTDKNGKPVDDIDSVPDEWNEGEDDQDKEYIKLTYFDLALRKFITGVNDKEVTNRIPQVSYDKENNKITYNHTKEPVEVVTNDIVVYTIRVYNEGQVDGYASKVSDDLPAGLEYLPNNELNKEYRWVMYDKDGKETTEVSEAVKITTDYLSKEQGEARMKENLDIKENPALLKAFDGDKEISETNPDYADVQVAFKVVEPNTSDKIIINSAQISDDTNKNGKPIDDIDSIPDEWNDGEDDQDKEYIKLTYFDLALRKWVTQAIVVEDGKETVTQTGHTPEQDPEPVVKVELNRKKLSSLTVKFKYSIRVTNEGDIAGYAKEITDYVPEGLKFVAEDNNGWTDEGNNVISTRLLENKLLQPGESADVEVTLTWINGKDNLGLKTNIAEISEDYNDKGAHDIDSTPDNKVPGEDDQDDAPVLISITTGQARIYFTLGFVILITIAGGIILIKKFVL